MSSILDAGAVDSTGWEKALSGPRGFKGGGSFRGKPFFVREANSQVGRRTQVHEFPGSDVATVDDMGKKVRRFKLECYTLGSNWNDNRDDLVKEFETAGPGRLIHPFWGTYTVTVDGPVDINESYEFGGMAKFTLTVVEAGVLAAPTMALDTANGVLNAASGLVSSVSAAMAAVFAVAGFASTVVAAAINAVNAVTQTLNSIKGKINAVMATIDSIGDAITSFASVVTQLILLPGQLANQLSALVNDVIGSAQSIGSAWDSYFASGETPGGTVSTTVAPSDASPASADARAKFVTQLAKELYAGTTVGGLYNVTPGLVNPPSTNVTIDPVTGIPTPMGGAFAPTPGTVIVNNVITGNTPNLVQQQINTLAIQQLVQASGTAALAAASVALPFGSAAGAIAMMNTVVEQVDFLTQTVTDDAVYAALVQLRAAVVQHLSFTAMNLPAIITYTPPQTLPALVLSQQLYATPDMAEDLIARNNITDPSMAAGGVTLEILVNA